MKNGEKEAAHHSDTEPMPDIAWWMPVMSIISIILIGLGWWYLLPHAYNGFMNELYRPWLNASPVITVDSIFLATPFFVFGLLAIFAMMVLILIAGPLKLSQPRINRVFQAFLWLGLVALVFGLLAKPAAWGISTYLEGAGYHECEQHTRIDLFITTRTLVQEPGLCDEL